ARDRVDRIYHSDSLFSAISSAMARMGMLDEWLAATVDAQQVRISSCFPRQRDLLFITPPRSLWPPAPSARVRWKGARFVPLKLVSQLLNDKPANEDSWV